jgi:hypothetical protein
MERTILHHARREIATNFGPVSGVDFARRGGLYSSGMKKMMWPILLGLLSGCYYEGYERRVALAPVPPPVTAQEAERMAAAGVSEAVLLEQIDMRGSRALSVDDMVAIKKAGASDAVIARMQATVRKDPEVVYVDSPVVYRSYYYGPYWYPTWGFGYTYWGHRGGVGVRVW